MTFCYRLTKNLTENTHTLWSSYKITVLLHNYIVCLKQPLIKITTRWGGGGGGGGPGVVHFNVPYSHTAEVYF